MTTELALSLEHPIDPTIRSDIEARLTAIEAEHQVHILFACESGSRGWGFSSPDSDYDVRFLYVHTLSWYLQVHAQRDVIELPISDVLDINGWELRKALGLLRGGNATLIEWLDSPVLYRVDPIFLQAIQTSARDTHRAERTYYHYVHMARKNYREHLRGETVRLKKYLYVLRPLLAARWIEQGRGVAPMRFQELVDGIVTDPALRQAIEALLLIKRSAMESALAPPMPVINAFIEDTLEHFASISPPTPDPKDFSTLDSLLMETVMRYETANQKENA